MQGGYLMAGWAGCVIRRERTVGSTNDVARVWAREGAPHGAVVVAAAQTASRGRRGHIWASMEDAGLWLSIILRPSVPEALYPLLSFAAAVSARDACAALTGQNVRLKWPNDVLLLGRKIAGILLEKEGGAAIVGIGINVSQRAEDFPEEIRGRAGSLSMLSGKDIPLAALEAHLLAALEGRVDNWSFMREYEKHCATLDRGVYVEAAGGGFCGVATGLAEDGALIVRDENGTGRRVLAGEVSIREAASSPPSLKH